MRNCIKESQQYEGWEPLLQDIANATDYILKLYGKNLKVFLVSEHTTIFCQVCEL